jgi:long-chain acyl-CoA synthetase
MVVGNGRPHPIALVVPNFQQVRQELGIPAGADDDLVRRPEVVAFMRREVLDHTRDLSPWEHVRNVILLPRELSIEDGELSPTMKIKRRVIEERYGQAIDDLYGALEPALRA